MEVGLGTNQGKVLARHASFSKAVISPTCFNFNPNRYFIKRYISKMLNFIIQVFNLYQEYREYKQHIDANI